MDTTQDNIEDIITATAWGREAADEARRQGWEGGSDAGDVVIGVCGVDYWGLRDALLQALGRRPAEEEIEAAKGAAYKAACERLDETA